MSDASQIGIPATVAAASSPADTVTLAGGVEMPVLGYGTWLIREGVDDAVASAIEAGYRHIDTASIYKNEVGVGEGLRRAMGKLGLAREDLFVTSKLWKSGRGYRQAHEEFEATMDRLGLDYLDLYLVHWPVVPVEAEDWLEQNLDTWRAMTELHEAGRIRAIGVSNHEPHHLAMFDDDSVRVAPAVNQIEFHPGFVQESTLVDCARRGIAVEAWSPLGYKGGVLDDPVVAEIAARHGVTPAQAILRWCLQEGVVPLTRSIRPERMAENAACFGFELSDPEMRALEAAGCGRLGGDPNMAPP